MLECRLGIAVQLVPVRGAPVQDGDELRLALGKLALEQVAEKVVVAVPLTLVVEWHQKQVRPFDLLELARRTLVVEYGVAERAAHSVEHRGSPQESKCTGT